MAANKFNAPPVGVLAMTTNIAKTLAHELGIKNAYALSPKSVVGGAARGWQLQSLLVDDSAWPLHPDVAKDLLPALRDSGGYIMKIQRFDPKKKAS